VSVDIARCKSDASLHSNIAAQKRQSLKEELKSFACVSFTFALFVLQSLRLAPLLFLHFTPFSLEVDLKVVSDC